MDQRQLLALQLASWQRARTLARLIREAEHLWHVDVRDLQRLGALELQIQNQLSPHPEELASLRTVETLLEDCRTLLDQSPPQAPGEVVWEDWPKAEAEATP